MGNPNEDRAYANWIEQVRYEARAHEESVKAERIQEEFAPPDMMDYLEYLSIPRASLWTQVRAFTVRLLTGGTLR